MHPSIRDNFTLNKDDFFQAYTKHVFAHLDRQNIVRGVKEVFQNFQLHFNFFFYLTCQF